MLTFGLTDEDDRQSFEEAEFPTVTLDHLLGHLAQPQPITARVTGMFAVTDIGENWGVPGTIDAGDDRSLRCSMLEWSVEPPLDGLDKVVIHQTGHGVQLVRVGGERETTLTVDLMEKMETELWETFEGMWPE